MLTDLPWKGTDGRTDGHCMLKGRADQESVRHSVALHQGRICLSALIQSLSQRRVPSSLAPPAIYSSFLQSLANDTPHHSACSTSLTTHLGLCRVST